MTDQQLKSWTRTLNEQDALLLLEQALEEPSLPKWREGAHQELPQASRARRQETVRIVERELLDTDGERVVVSRYLRLFSEGRPGRRHDLLYGRLLFAKPWIRLAVVEVVLPQLANAEEPLAPRDADEVAAEAWDALLGRHLAPGTGPESVKKTRSTLQRNLAKLGVLLVEGATSRRTRVRRAEPDELAFGWLLWHELRTQSRAEASLAWAITESAASRMFATTPGYAERCVEAAVAAGLLRQGFLAGSPRLHPGEID